MLVLQRFVAEKNIIKMQTNFSFSQTTALSCHASHMPLPIVYAHSNWHTLEVLSNQAKLAGRCRFWQIWAFQSSSQPSGGVFCVLITSHLAQCTAELAGATGRWGLSWDTQTAVGDRSQGRMQWRKGSQLACLGWQERWWRGPEIPEEEQKKEEELAQGRIPLRHIWQNWNIHMLV